MNTWFRTPHRLDVRVDISSMDFWSRDFDDRDTAFAQLRREAPVSWQPPIETPGLPDRRHEAGFWAVTTVTEIAYVSRHPQLFSSEIGQVSVRPAPFRLDPNMLVVDAPDHTELRRVVGSAFTPAALATLEASIDRHARRIILRARHKGSFDFVSEVAAPLPLLTLAALLGIPATEVDAFVAAADSHVGGRIPSDASPHEYERQFAQSAAYLTHLFSALCAWRRHTPGDDLLTRLVQATVDGVPMTDEAIQSTLMLLVVAGNDTTKQAITLTALALDRFRGEREWLTTGDGFDARFDAAFDELIRFASPVISFARTATQDLELAGRSVTAGDKIALFYCSGNRDESEFADPAHLDLRRGASSQVGFGGGGVHFCLGNRLARAQMRAVFREIATRMPNLEVGEAENGFSDSVRSVVSLPATC